MIIVIRTMYKLLVSFSIISDDKLNCFYKFVMAYSPGTVGEEAYASCCANSAPSSTDYRCHAGSLVRSHHHQQIPLLVDCDALTQKR